MGILDAIGGIPSVAASAIPAPVAAFTGLGAVPGTPINEQLPSYRSQLTSKYADPDIAKALAALDEGSRNSLLAYDADRVSRGQPPLTREQTHGAITTIATGRPATPAPDRSPMDIFGNAISDLTNIVKSVPKLPGALIHEVQDLPRAGQKISDMEAQGYSPLRAMLNAPGVRLIPGAYTLGNLTGGTAGIKEAITHPLMSALDVLPGAEAWAKSTEVGSEATRVAEAAGKSPRTLKAVLTRTLDEDGALVPNKLGTLTQSFRDNTKLGQLADQIGGERNRAMARYINEHTNKIQEAYTGRVTPEQFTRDTDQAAARVAKATSDLAGKYNFDPATMDDFTRRLTMDDWTDASPELLAAKHAYREQTLPLADIGIKEGELGHIVNPDTGISEVVTHEQAQRVTTARQRADFYQRMTGRRDRVLESDPSLHRAPDEIWSDVDSTIGRLETPVPGTKPNYAQTRLELRAISHELDAQGYDTSALAKVINAKGVPDPVSLRGTFQEALAGTPTPRLPASEIVKVFAPHGTAGDTLANDIAKAVRDENWSRVNSALRGVSKRTKFGIPELDDNPALRPAIKSLAERSRFADRYLKPFTEKSAARAEAIATKTLDRATPARFMDIVESRTQKAVTERFSNLKPDQAATIADHVLHKNWDAVATTIDMDPAAVRQLVGNTARDIASTWREMQASGLDPIFVHRVSPGQVHQALAPTLSEVPNSISSVRARAIDPSPSQTNAWVSLSHNASEWMRRHLSEDFIDWTLSSYGVKESELELSLRPTVEAYRERNPSLSLEAARQKVLSRSYTKFDPAEHGYSWGSPRLNSLANDQYWIPKSLAQNLRQMHDPKGVLGGVLDPVTKAFRTSVIALSPRNLLNNALGGATMVMGTAGPGAFRYFGLARQWSKDPALMMADPRVGEALQLSLGGQASVLKDLDHTQFTGKVLDAANFMKGRTLGRLWGEVQQSKAAETFHSLVNKSYDINGQWDDMYKTMAYLHGYDKAIGKGMTREAAETAGIELLRKTQPDWHSLTPIERNVIKSVIPFYGFMNHAIRYVMRYPMDHPLRAQLVSDFATSETADNAEYPGSFLGALFLGSPDSAGHANAINLTGANPFGDVANQMTLAGFLSSTNPAIQSVLEGVGVTSGSAELYPTLRFDPNTGRLAAVHPNPLLQTLSNIVPQTDILTALTGTNSDFMDRLHSDPAGAYRGLMSSAGLPILWRDYNVPQEIAKTEVARQKSANSVQAAAQKSGDWSEALRYPSLSAAYAQMQQLTPEQVAPYQPRPDEKALLIKEALAKLGTGKAQNQRPRVLATPPPASGSVSPLGMTGGI